MKKLKALTCFLALAISATAMPLALTREKGKETKTPDGDLRHQVIFKSGKDPVLVVTELRKENEVNPHTIHEMYFYHGSLVFDTWWRKETGTSHTFQASGDSQLQVSSEDSDGDRMVDSVLFTTDEKKAAGFERNEHGDMTPITPLILSKDGTVFYKQDGFEPVR